MAKVQKIFGKPVRLSNHLIKYTKYKWEFLRRNQNYIDDWEKLQNTKSTEDKIKFCKKWEISKPLNPDKSYGDFTHKNNIYEISDEESDETIELATTERLFSSWAIDIHLLMHNCLHPESVNIYPAKPVDESFKGTFRKFKIKEKMLDFDGEFHFMRGINESIAKTGKLKLQIDLNYSKRTLMKELEHLIDEWKMFYDEANKSQLFAWYSVKKLYEERPDLVQFIDPTIDDNSGAPEESFFEDPSIAELLRGAPSEEELTSFAELSIAEPSTEELTMEQQSSLEEIQSLEEKEFNKYFCIVGNEFRKNYKILLRERRKQYEKKYHFDNFDDYLKVYDLRKKAVSWSKVVSKLNLNSIQSARNHYNSAREIIEKGVEKYASVNIK